MELSVIRQQLISRFCAPLRDGSKVYDEILSSLGAFSSGIEGLDSILDGGIMCGEIIEIFGSSAVGKTQFCFQLAAHVTLTSNNSVLFIDTCGSFSARRIKQIMKENDAEDEKCASALARIIYQCCYDLYDFITILDQLIEDNHRKTGSDARRVKLIIIDSISSLIISKYDGNKSEGFGLANRIANKLKVLSSAFYKTIIMTNEQVDWGGEDPRPALGQYWASVPHIRLWFYKNTNDEQHQLRRRIQIYKSTRNETGKFVEVQLGVSGVTDCSLSKEI
ncbi:DNA repair protein rad51d [Chamberlinius hualienensis]